MIFKACHCNQLSFGTVDEVLEKRNLDWSPHPSFCLVNTVDTPCMLKHISDSAVENYDDGIFDYENGFSKLNRESGVQYDFSTIPQCDGEVDENEALHMKSSITKSIYAANCEISEVSIIAIFLRNCIHLWNTNEEHLLFEFSGKHKEMSCIYCFFRRCCLRLNMERKRGPKSLKLYEIVHQLFKFDKLNWD